MWACEITCLHTKAPTLMAANFPGQNTRPNPVLPGCHAALMLDCPWLPASCTYKFAGNIWVENAWVVVNRNTLIASGFGLCHSMNKLIPFTGIERTIDTASMFVSHKLKLRRRLSRHDSRVLNTCKLRVLENGIQGRHHFSTVQPQVLMCTFVLKNSVHTCVHFWIPI